MADDEKQRLVSKIVFLANLLVLSNFLSIRFVSDATRWTADFTVAAWIVFLAALVSVNVWLYYLYYRKPSTAQKT